VRLLIGTEKEGDHEDGWQQQRDPEHLTIVAVSPASSRCCTRTDDLCHVVDRRAEEYAGTAGSNPTAAVTSG